MASGARIADAQDSCQAAMARLFGALAIALRSATQPPRARPTYSHTRCSYIQIYALLKLVAPGNYPAILVSDENRCCRLSQELSLETEGRQSARDKLKRAEGIPLKQLTSLIIASVVAFLASAHNAPLALDPEQYQSVKDGKKECSFCDLLAYRLGPRRIRGPL
jgi:hypothetical protein